MFLFYSKNFNSKKNIYTLLFFIVASQSISNYSHFVIKAFESSFPLYYAVCKFFHFFSGGIFGDQVGQLAIITRCNYTLFNEASKMACETNNLKIAFAGVS